MKKGDVVQLKSGGPKMTISSLIGEEKSLTDTAFKMKGHKDGEAICIWFQAGKKNIDAFDCELLKTVPEK